MLPPRRPLPTAGVSPGTLLDLPKANRSFPRRSAYLKLDSPPRSRRPPAHVRQRRADGRRFQTIALKTGTTRGLHGRPRVRHERRSTPSGSGPATSTAARTAGVMAMQGAAPMVRAAFVALAARYGTPTAPDGADGRVDSSAATVCALMGISSRARLSRTSGRLSSPGTVPRRAATWHRRVVRSAGGGSLSRRRRRVGAGPRAALCPRSRLPGRRHCRGALRDARDHLSGRGGAFPARSGSAGGRATPTAPRAPGPGAGALEYMGPIGAADSFVPSPGTRIIKATLGDEERAITISFE